MTDLDRRAFFKRGLKKVSRTVVSYADSKATQKATQWIRPPYAIDELDFTLSCSRCGDCMAACKYEVIFPLPASYGASVVNTPAMDLKNKACHLCQDWPCVKACEPAVLKIPEAELAESELVEGEPAGTEINAVTKPSAPPKMALVKISIDSCLPYLGPECGACRSSCPVEGALSWDLTKPVINQDLCCGCGLCRQACITDPSSITIHNLSHLEGNNA